MYRGRLSSKAKRALIIELFIQQKCLCLYCKKPMSLQFGFKNSATLDHLVPRYCNGTNAKSNFGLACYSCNQDKANLTYNEYMEKLKDV